MMTSSVPECDGHGLHFIKNFEIAADAERDASAIGQELDTVSSADISSDAEIPL
jgi:hypothetical protein